MNTLFKLLDNSAFMGIIGLTLGGLITFLGGLVQSAHNNRHVEKMRCLEIDYTQKAELKDKKERAYLNFLIQRGMFLTIQTIQNDPTATDDAKREAASLLVEKFRKAFSESSELFAELDLYGSPEIAQRCGELSYKYALYDNGQFDDFSRELGEIVELMRIDLVEIPLHSRR